MLWLRFLSGPDIDGLGLTNAEIVAAVEEAVRAHGAGHVVVEPRVHLVPDLEGPGHFNVLRGHLSVPGVSGVKVVGDFVANYAAGLPSELGLLTLYDPQTGVPLSIMDATLITACRTGAMTAVGARYLARPEARVLGHVGARGTAFWNVVLLDELFDLDEIRITSRRPESREAFARQLAEVTATPVRVAVSPAEVFDGADILVEASRLTEPEPLLRTAWVKPGAFVVPYGTISAVELDLLDVMDKVVVDDWREAQSGRFGALRRHVDTGRLSAGSLHAELGQVVTGRRPGRERADERILFWHRGLAIRIGPGTLAAVGQQRAAALRELAAGAPVYGVNTGMGALSSVRLTEAQQRSHQRNLFLARAVGGPPWLDGAGAPARPGRSFSWRTRSVRWRASGASCGRTGPPSRRARRCTRPGSASSRS